MENLENEIWVAIEGFPFYEVSNTGKVKRLKRFIYKKNNSVVTIPEEILKNQRVLIDNQKGGTYYQTIMLLKSQCVRKHQLVHRLVAKAFIPNPENKPCINHINGLGDDNRIENLEWCTQSENRLHAIHVLGHKPALNMKGRTGGLNQRAKIVNQFDKDDNLIATYNSVGEAAEATGADRQSISHCCTGTQNRKISHGFKWSYANVPNMFNQLKNKNK